MDQRRTEHPTPEPTRSETRAATATTTARQWGTPDPTWIGLPFQRGWDEDIDVQPTWEQAGTCDLDNLLNWTTRKAERWKREGDQARALLIETARDRLRPHVRDGKFYVEPMTTRRAALTTSKAAGSQRPELKRRARVRRLRPAGLRLPPSERANLADIIKKLERIGAITTHPAGSAPEDEDVVVHEIFLVKKRPTGWRAIADLRVCNKRFDIPPTFGHPRVQAAFDPARQWATKLDIGSAFYKFPVHKSIRNMFTFADTDGRPMTYQGLPMGWAWSPVLMDAALGCLDAVWAAEGMTIVRYADDILVLGRSPCEVQRMTRQVIRDLAEVGAQAAVKKTYAGAFQRLEFLGWLLDLVHGTAKWDAVKAEALRSDVNQALEPGGATLQLLQKITGKLVFLTSFVPVLRSFYRGICAEIGTRCDARNEGEQPQEQRRVVQWETRRDLKFWSDIIPALTARWFRNPTPRPEARSIQAEVDASAVGVGVILRWEGTKRVVSRTLSDDDVNTASGVREMEAVRCAIKILLEEKLHEPPTQPVDLEIATDAMITAHVMTRGSARAADMVNKMKDIAALMLSVPNLVIRMTWRPREDNTEADAASRAVGSEATLKAEYVRTLMGWGTGRPEEPDVDLFATNANTKARRYFSRVPDQQAQGRDGLRPWPWPTGATTWYAFPPFPLAERAYNLFESLRARRIPGVMVLPWTRVAPWIHNDLAKGDAIMIDAANVQAPPGANLQWRCNEALVALRTKMSTT